MNITSKLEFDNISAILCGRMVSLDRATQEQAAEEAAELISSLPKMLASSPHCKDEITAINTLIAKVRAS